MMRIVGSAIVLACFATGCSSRGDRGHERQGLALPDRTPARTVVARPRADSVQCARLRPADSLATSREGFIQELFDARATHRTPRFDAYHDDSYGVNKQDVATGLVEVSRACGLPLRGVVILGPVGPLWAYYVLTFLQESPEAIRVNNTVMPHARITEKSTATIALSTYDSVLRALTEAPPVEPRPYPRAAHGDSSALSREFSYDLLIVQVIGDSTAEWSAVLGQNPDTAAAERTLRPIDRMLKELKQTYPTAAIGPRQGRNK